jgi:hypothetical protein
MLLHGYEAIPFYGYASLGPWEFGGEIEFLFCISIITTGVMLQSFFPNTS